MSSHWMRRALRALAFVSALLMVACGSGTIESQLRPSRIVVFGDGFSDLGQAGARYSVNDGGINIWSQQLAADFGVNLTTAAAGGTSFATRNARISSKPDTVGSSATPTVTEQIDSFLAQGPIGSNDLVVVGGGIGDIVAEMGKVTSGAQTSDQMLAAVKQAGHDLAGQVRRLVTSGASHVVVIGTYDLGRSPWAIGSGQTSLLSQASGKFNDEMLVTIVDLGANVLYVDAALLYNLMIAVPSGYGMTNSADPVCTSVDAGPGIGIGAGQLNSALCTPSTVLAGVNYNLYLFADRVYPAPQAHRQFGDYAHTRIQSRW